MKLSRGLIIKNIDEWEFKTKQYRVIHVMYWGVGIDKITCNDGW